MMHPAVDSDLQTEGGGGGRTLQNFVRGGSDPRSNHLLSNAFINMFFFYRKRTPSVYLSKTTCILRFKTLVLV